MQKPKLSPSKLITTVLYAIVAFVLACLLPTLAGKSDHNVLYMPAVLPVIGFSVAAIIGILRNKATLPRICFWGTILHVLLFIMGANNFPEFIRSIPGSNFVGIWCGCAAVVLAVCMLLLACTRKRMKEKILEDGKKLIYSDNDLMLMRNFSSYRMAGYALLKAKLHNVILVHTEGETEDSCARTLVSINPEIPPAELRNYCIANAQVNKIVGIIQKAQLKAGNSDPIPMETVLSRLTPPTKRTSKGGLYLEIADQRLRKVSLRFCTAAISLSYSLGWLKLIMGINNGKPTDNLFLVMAVFLFAFFFAFIISVSFSMTAVCRQIVAHKQEQFKDARETFANTDLDAPGMANEKVSMILRAYALHSFDQEQYPVQAEKMPFAMSIFQTAAALEAAAKAASASDDSGCSGCSSCGGCGGGCGGCGGCGD